MPTRYAAVIRSVGRYLPSKVVTNHDLSKVMDTSDEWIRERTGIRQRHIAQEGESTSGLAVEASKHALDQAGWKSTDLELILAATLSPDYYFPGIGVLVQSGLQASTIPALDIRGQCSGFAWCLATADAYVRTGRYRKVLVVGAEIHSRLIEFSNRGRDVSVLFGDAAGAVCLEAVPAERDPRCDNQVRGIIDSSLGSDGSGARELYIPRPGHAGDAEFMTKEETESKAWLPAMAGRQVFKNAVTRMLEVCEELLGRNDVSPADIDLLVPHQANLRINQMVAKKLGLREDQVFNNIDRYGNTTAATLPLVMHDAVAEGILKPGMLVLTVAFGSGFTWAANLIRW